jgi:hypothetical protein
MELLLDIAKTIKDSLLGPCGTYYLSMRKDDLNDLAFEIWNKFVVQVKR